MYYEYFGLSQPPFKITPNTAFFFPGGNRGPILEALVYAVTQGEGIVKVTGEVGSGKTMLCRMLESSLPDTVETIYLANPSVEPGEILHAIAFELHLAMPHQAPRLEVMQQLQDYLLGRHAAGKQVVIFVEEAQAMPTATLEEIRLLSNLETENHKLLQIVLFGQPELDEILTDPGIRQLKERITHSFRLEPLNTGDIRAYIDFRMRQAGYKGPDVFSVGAMREISRASLGLTRRINIIADKALLAAYAERTHNVSSRHVIAAAKDSEFIDIMPRRPWWMAFAGIGLLVLGIGIGLALGPWFKPPPEAENVAAVTAEPVATDVTPATEPAPLAPATVAPTATTTATPATTAPVTTSVKPATTPPHLDTAAQFEPKAQTFTPPPAQDLGTARLASTAQWLANAHSDTVTIHVQLLGAGDPKRLENYLEELGKLVDIQQVFVYRTKAAGKPAYSVTFGAYADRASANAAMAQLPARLRAQRPYLRTVQGVRDEVGVTQ